MDMENILITSSIEMLRKSSQTTSEQNKFGQEKIFQNFFLA